MGDVGEELALGDGGAVALGVAHHALEHDPAAGDVAVVGQVDPAHAAVGDHARDLVLVGDHIPGMKGGFFHPGGLLGRVAQGEVFRDERDKRQHDHAVGHRAGLAGGAATGAEGG